MAGKRRVKRTTSTREDLSKPTPWRLQHGDFNPPSHDADPETGAVVVHRRAVDLLGQLEANGTITAPMRDAGDTFRAQFRAAALDTLSAASLMRVGGGGNSTPTERVVNARRRVAVAMTALGGQDNAAGSCVWHVVGCEMSIREWAARQGWGGRPVGHAQAQGMLVAALSVLAGHYGHTRTPRAA
jgi:hypothetical protein